MLEMHLVTPCIFLIRIFSTLLIGCQVERNTTQAETMTVAYGITMGWMQMENIGEIGGLVTAGTMAPYVAWLTLLVITVIVL